MRSSAGWAPISKGWPSRMKRTRAASVPGPAPATTAAIRRALLSWYARSQRELPWRKNKDPYRVWVSEVMLQQTTVKTVTPYYEAFLARFPSLAALAAAEEEQV